MKTHIRHQNGISIFEPRGKIVGPSVSKLRQALLPEIEASASPRILINFKRVRMIDCSGLATLIEAHTAITRKNGRMGAIEVGRHIKNLTVMSRILQHFEHFDTEAEAVATFSDENRNIN